MKKLLLSLFIFIFTLPAFSQLIEQFDFTTGVTGQLPATWALPSGNWAVFEHNSNALSGTTQSWGINPFAAGIFYSPTNCASVSREDIGAGNTSQDFLATPAVHVSDVGSSSFSFYTRMFSSGNQGTIFKIMIAPAVNPAIQMDPTAYTVVQQWSEDNLITPTTDFNVWTQKTVDLSAYAGFDVYIAFVREYTQPTANMDGDRWLIDDVNLNMQPSCFVSAYATLSSTTSVDLNVFTNNGSAVEAMIVPCDDPAPLPTDNGISVGSIFQFTNLIPNTCYKVYVKNTCHTPAVWQPITVTYTRPQIRLVAFFDTNNNGIMDNGEAHYNNGHFIITPNNSGAAFSVYSSYYGFVPSTTSTSFDFNYQINPTNNNCVSLGSFNYDDVVPSFLTQTFYFPIIATPGCFDNQVILSTGTAARPGMNNFDHLNIAAFGTNAPAMGVLTYTKASQATMVSVTPSAGIVYTPTGFTYNYSGLSPTNTINLTITTSTPPIPTVNLGDILNSSASISFTPDDINLANNSSNLAETVVASYDPNDISEYHGPQIQFDQFVPNDYLYYTIRFENTGNANAIKVRVDNVLDSKIDETSISMINAGHDYVMVRNGNAISWEFNNIQLPPASVNEDLSNGFINFRVKPKPGYAIGDIIPSVASIYFDSNPPIITNTFNTEFVATLGNPTFDTEAITIVPNPSSDIIMITNGNVEKITKTIIYDISGKKIYELDNNSIDSIRIDVSDFSKGMYLIELISENKFKSIKKLIIR